MDDLDLSKLDLVIIQIDGIYIEEDLMLLGTVGIDGDGGKHPLGVVEGATENNQHRRPCHAARRPRQKERPVRRLRCPATHWAIALTLSQSTKLNGLDPLAYLTNVLTRIVSGQTKTNQLDQLLP